MYCVIVEVVRSTINPRTPPTLARSTSGFANQESTACAQCEARHEVFGESTGG